MSLIDFAADLTTLRHQRRRFVRACWSIALAAPINLIHTSSVFGQSSPAAKTDKAVSAPKILVVGDSLSAEYGITRNSGWVALAEQRIQNSYRGRGIKLNSNLVVINASISGETTSGGRSRINDLLQKHRPTHFVLELGANDALRGLPLAQTESNLKYMVQAAKKIGAKVTLIGIRIPPNYGKSYTESFVSLFAILAKSESTELVPFMLDGFAEKPEFFQKDRIHPNEKAQPIILDNIWPALSKSLGLR